jgi:hypothetical protein
VTVRNLLDEVVFADSRGAIPHIRHLEGGPPEDLLVIDVLHVRIIFVQHHPLKQPHYLLVLGLPLALIDGTFEWELKIVNSLIPVVEKALLVQVVAAIHSETTNL